MLFNDLFTVLSGIISQERVEIYMRAWRTLYDLHGDQINTKSQEIVQNTKGEDIYVRYPAITDYTLDLLKESLLSFGIRLNPEMTTGDNLEIITNLLSGYLELDVYEDPQVFLNILQEDDDIPVNKFVTVVAEVSDSLPEEYLTVLDSIQENVLPRMLEVFTLKVKELKESEENIPASEALQRFIREKAYKYIDKTILDGLGTNPHRISLESILRLYGKRLADEKTNPEYGWVYILLFQKNYDDKDALMQLFNTWDNYFLEENDILFLQNKVTKLYHHYTEGTDA